MSEETRETLRGLPGPLPEGERLLWQGAPDPFAVLKGALRLPWVAGYFAVLVLWTIVAGVGEAVPAKEIATRLTGVVGAGLAVVALLALYAWAVARTTVYTVTDRRVVIRHGVALFKTLNIPFRQVASAALKLDPAGTGDLPLTLAEGQKIAFLHLWPHARPWRVFRPEPMLRGVPDAAKVAEILADALKAAHPLHATETTITAPAPSRPVRVRARRAVTA